MPSSDRWSPESVPDLAELGKIFEEHRPRLEAMVHRRLDRTLAARLGPEDVLADAFLQARRKWPAFKKNQPALPAYVWLYRIVMDTLIEGWRRHSRGPRDLHRDLPWPEQSSIELAFGLLNPVTSPSAAFARAELRDQVRQTLNLLKDSDRQILWMRHYDDLSFKEAALVLDITESAATLRYVRALDRLKKLWQQFHPDQDSSS